ncbi:hypothetical protein, partial [Aquitalea magnusonii]|uniref:hypothetical protein n=1 Tax=Aquitalea magnusonii TaxID=332411 RepID=UPI00137B3643
FWFMTLAFSGIMDMMNSFSATTLGRIAMSDALDHQRVLPHRFWFMTLAFSGIMDMMNSFSATTLGRIAMSDAL